MFRISAKLQSGSTARFRSNAPAIAAALNEFLTAIRQPDSGASEGDIVSLKVSAPRSKSAALKIAAPRAANTTPKTRAKKGK